MVTTLELLVLVIALALLFGSYTLIRTFKPLIVNAVVGVIVLVVANALGMGVQITPIAILICALGGVPGAFLVVILAWLDVAFAGMVTPVGLAAL